MLELIERLFSAIEGFRDIPMEYLKYLYIDASPVCVGLHDYINERVKMSQATSSISEAFYNMQNSDDDLENFLQQIRSRITLHDFLILHATTLKFWRQFVTKEFYLYMLNNNFVILMPEFHEINMIYSPVKGTYVNYNNTPGKCQIVLHDIIFDLYTGEDFRGVEEFVKNPPPIIDERDVDDIIRKNKIGNYVIKTEDYDKTLSRISKLIYAAMVDGIVDVSKYKLLDKCPYFSDSCRLPYDKSYLAGLLHFMTLRDFCYFASSLSMYGENGINDALDVIYSYKDSYRPERSFDYCHEALSRLVKHPELKKTDLSEYLFKFLIEIGLSSSAKYVLYGFQKREYDPEKFYKLIYRLHRDKLHSLYAAIPYKVEKSFRYLLAEHNNAFAELGEKPKMMPKIRAFCVYCSTDSELEYVYVLPCSHTICGDCFMANRRVVCWCGEIVDEKALSTPTLKKAYTSVPWTSSTEIDIDAEKFMPFNSQYKTQLWCGVHIQNE